MSKWRVEDYEPHDEPTNAGLQGIAVVCLLLALFTLFMTAAPVVWGESIGRISATPLISAQEPLTPEQAKEREEVKKKVAVYDSFRFLYVSEFFLGLAAFAGLLWVAYMARNGEMYFNRATAVLILAFVLILVNRILGWGGWWAIVALLVTLAVAIAVNVPIVRRYLADELAEDEQGE